MRDYAVISLAAIMLCIGCTKPLPRLTLARVATENERIALYGFEGVERFAGLPGWPRDSASQAILKSEFDKIHDLLLAEFHRCEKYGLYAVVDTTQSPTIRVSLSFNVVPALADSLHVNIRMDVTNRIVRDSLHSYGFYTAVPVQANAPSALHQLGLTLAEYRRSFPYQKIVSYFYPDRNP